MFRFKIEVNVRITREILNLHFQLNSEINVDTYIYNEPGDPYDEPGEDADPDWPNGEPDDYDDNPDGQKWPPINYN